MQVWYAASYAEFVNQKIHDISEEERKGGCTFYILYMISKLYILHLYAI